jgi:hypothetical protein
MIAQGSEADLYKEYYGQNHHLQRPKKATTSQIDAVKDTSNAVRTIIQCDTKKMQFPAPAQ